MTTKAKKASKLDAYEQELEDAFDHSESLEPAKKARTVKMLQKAASNYLKKDTRITHHTNV